MEPRCLQPGTTFLVRRRIHHGVPVFRGTADDRSLTGFTFGWTQERVRGVSAHGLTFMPDGYWAVLTHEYAIPGDIRVADDAPVGARQEQPIRRSTEIHTGPCGIPDFCRELNRILSQNVNARLGQTGESLWQGGSYRAIELPSVADVLHAMVEVALLPLSRGLVQSEERYPLLRRLFTSPGGHFRRPEPYHSFAAPKPPDYASLNLDAPRVENFETGAFREAYERRREIVLRRSKSFIGSSVLAEPNDQLDLKAPDIQENTPAGRKLSPWTNHIAASLNARVEDEATDSLAEFRLAYRRCLEQLRAMIPEGTVTVVFPFGTWGLARYLNVPVRGSPTYVASRP